MVIIVIMVLRFCIFLQRDHYVTRQFGQRERERKKKRVTIGGKAGVSFRSKKE